MADSWPVTIPETIAKLISTPVSSFLKFKVSSLDLRVKAQNREYEWRQEVGLCFLSSGALNPQIRQYYKSLNKGVQSICVRQKRSIKWNFQLPVAIILTIFQGTGPRVTSEKHKRIILNFVPSLYYLPVPKQRGWYSLHNSVIHLFVRQKWRLIDGKTKQPNSCAVWSRLI